MEIRNCSKDAQERRIKAKKEARKFNERTIKLFKIWKECKIPLKQDEIDDDLNINYKKLAVRLHKENLKLKEKITKISKV